VRSARGVEVHPPKKDTFGQFMAGLTRVQAQGAPISGLVNAETTAETAHAYAQNAPATEALGVTFAEIQDTTAIGTAMRQVNTECGVPASWHVATIAVP
jgi:hypothetical protein